MASGAADGGSTPLRNVEVYMFKLIDGNSISNDILEELKNQASILNVTGKNRVLVDIFVGDDEASKVYIENKKKKFNFVGLKFNQVNLPSNTTEEELIRIIEKYNNDIDTNAIFVELPLPKHINEKNIIDRIDPCKDVDGFGIKCLGSLIQGASSFFPCTAEGIIELLKRSKIEISGKHCVVIGRSNIVGKPVAILMLNENSTVTICHSKTKELKSICKSADILIVAIGKPKLIDDSYIKEGAIVIDAGIHRSIVDGKKVICGDVDFDKVAPHTSYITPVPGGVGPMTVTMLIKHCIDTVNCE